jgi:hypothetical protein
MTTQEKKDEIKALVIELLNQSNEAMINNIDKVLKSEAIDIDSWASEINPMIIPKCITTALLEQECTQWDASGTSFEKQIKKEVKNIRYFL